jgi:ribosome maturation protein Sdo1
MSSLTKNQKPKCKEAIKRFQLVDSIRFARRRVTLKIEAQDHSITKGGLRETAECVIGPVKKDHHKNIEN